MLDKIFDGNDKGNIAATIATLRVYAEALDERKERRKTLQAASQKLRTLRKKIVSLDQSITALQAEAKARGLLLPMA